MCGRFVSREQAAIEREYNIRVLNPFERVYNAAPSMHLPVIRRAAADPAVGGGAGANATANPVALEALTMRWGLVPGWWSKPSLPTSTINARSEEAAAKPMWRNAVRQTRCLVPALGWYEWKPAPEGKVPYFIHLPQMAGLCFAGLWSEWRDPEGETQRTFAILTRIASPTMQAVHNRMPVVLPQPAWTDWLAAWPGDHAHRLADHVANALNDFEFYAVSRYVNTPRNQGERCIEPAAA